MRPVAPRPRPRPWRALCAASSSDLPRSGPVSRCYPLRKEYIGTYSALRNGIDHVMRERRCFCSVWLDPLNRRSHFQSTRSSLCDPQATAARQVRQACRADLLVNRDRDVQRDGACEPQRLFGILAGYLELTEIEDLDRHGRSNGSSSYTRSPPPLVEMFFRIVEWCLVFVLKLLGPASDNDRAFSKAEARILFGDDYS